MKENNAWNIRHLEDESFVPLAQQTSELYCRLSDLRSYRPDIYNVPSRTKSGSSMSSRTGNAEDSDTRFSSSSSSSNIIILFFCENSLQIRIVGMILKFSLPLEIFLFIKIDKIFGKYCRFAVYWPSKHKNRCQSQWNFWKSGGAISNVVGISCPPVWNTTVAYLARVLWVL